MFAAFFSRAFQKMKINLSNLKISVDVYKINFRVFCLILLKDRRF